MSMHEHRPRHKWSNFITTRPKRSCRSQKPKCFGHISHHNSPDKDIRRKAVILEEFCQCRISSDSAGISNVSITNRTGRDSLCRSRIPKPVIGSLPACSLASWIRSNENAHVADHNIHAFIGQNTTVDCVSIPLGMWLIKWWLRQMECATTRRWQLLRNRERESN